MAKILGKEKKSFQKNLFVGVAQVIPIVFNPTNEQLAAVTKGEKNFDNAIKYVFTDVEGANSYKFDIWCKLPYVLAEDGSMFQPHDLTTPDLKVDYICYSWWGRDKQDIILDKDDNSVKGVWYVNSNTCEMTWVPKGNVDAAVASNKNRFNFSHPKSHIATQGEKELLTFLEKLLRIEEIDLETPFKSILKGNTTEINAVLKANLQRTDRTPRAVKLLLGIRETEDASYQSTHQIVMSEDTTNYNRLRDNLSAREWKDDRSEGDFTLRVYTPKAPSGNSVVKTARLSASTIKPNSNRPAQSAW